MGGVPEKGKNSRIYECTGPSLTWTEYKESVTTNYWFISIADYKSPIDELLSWTKGFTMVQQYINLSTSFAHTTAAMSSINPSKQRRNYGAIILIYM